MIAHYVSRSFISVLAKSLPIQKFILGKVCLKAVVKVAPSLQRLASARQIGVKEEEKAEDMLLDRFADETDLPDWYFIWFLRFNSFWFYQCVYFCKKS